MSRRDLTIAGWVYVVIFPLTGAWMRFTFPEAHDGDLGVRMMYRSAHLYILFGGVMNLLVSIGYRPRTGWRRVVQVAGSIALIVAPALFVLAFFFGPDPDNVARPFVAYGTYLIVLGTFLHLLGGRAAKAD